MKYLALLFAVCATMLSTQNAFAFASKRDYSFSVRLLTNIKVQGASRLRNYDLSSTVVLEGLADRNTTSGNNYNGYQMYYHIANPGGAISTINSTCDEMVQEAFDEVCKTTTPGTRIWLENNYANGGYSSPPRCVIRTERVRYDYLNGIMFMRLLDHRNLNGLVEPSFEDDLAGIIAISRAYTCP